MQRSRHVPRTAPCTVGGLRITRGEALIAGFVSAKIPALLCYLAVTARPHFRAELAGLLWGEQSDAAAAANLRQALTNLRRLVGSHLIITPQTVTFNRDIRYWLDVEILREKVDQYASRQERDEAAHAWSTGLPELREAAELCQGEFLQGFYVRDAPSFNEWALGQREYMRQVALQAFYALAAHHTARGEYAQAIRYVTRLLEIEPWREEAHRHLLLLLARSGQRSAALAQYETCRRILKQELDVEPMAETTALYEQIKTDTLPPLLRNWPAQLTPFIGREKELGRIVEQLQAPKARLVTLTGPGGVGKTRLALEAASQAAFSFRDGACFASLAAVSAPEFIIPAIASALQVTLSGLAEPKEQLFNHLRQAQPEMLLLLDNLERLIEAAPLATDLLALCPKLKILVTSRELLRVSGEQPFLVPPLDLPNGAQPAAPATQDLARYSAIAFFVSQARAARPDFSLTEENAAAVAAICARLDGLPLSIELAAARCRALSPQMILGQLNNRLALLTGGARDLPARQQTLRATLDWSYNLLDADEEKLFARLAVFMDGSTLEAVESVYSEKDRSASSKEEPGSSDALRLLESLLDKSLLQRQETAGGDPRFTMLETIREYALEKLMTSCEWESLQGRHAAYYLALAEQAEPELGGAQQGTWLDRLEIEHNNLRAALRWTLESKEAEMALRLSGALWRFWYWRGYLSEGRRWLESALAISDSGFQAQRQDSDTHAQPSPIRARAQALTGAGMLASDQDDYAQAVAWLEAGLELWRLQDNARAASILVWLGSVAYNHGDTDRSEVFYEEGLALCRELGDAGKPPLAFALNQLGLMAQHRGDRAAARRLCEESLALWRELGARDGIACALYNLGMLAHDEGDDAQAAPLFREGLLLAWEMKEKRGIAEALSGLAVTACALGQAARAARLLGQIEILFSSIGFSPDPAVRADYDQRVAHVRAQLDQATFASAWAEGRAMTLDQIIAYALANDSEVCAQNMSGGSLPASTRAR